MTSQFHRSLARNDHPRNRRPLHDLALLSYFTKPGFGPIGFLPLRAYLAARRPAPKRFISRPKPATP